LDKFIYVLLAKCPNDLLVILVEAIQKQLTTTTTKIRDLDAQRVVKRLIRSVTRLFVILCIETSPMHLQLNLNLSNKTTTPSSSSSSNMTSPTKAPSSQSIRSSAATTTYSTSSLINSKLARLKSLTNHFSSNSNSNSSSSNSSSSSSQIALLVTVTPLSKCEYVLRQFAEYAVSELADVANSLIGPVIMGVTKPTTFKVSMMSSSASGSACSNSNSSSSSSNGEFSGSSSISSSSSNNGSMTSPLAEELFNLEPSLLRQINASISTSIVSVRSSSNGEQDNLKDLKGAKIGKNLEAATANSDSMNNNNNNNTNPQFINTFETVVDVTVPPPSLLKSQLVVPSSGVNVSGK
jgi:hypothetical protein